MIRAPIVFDSSPAHLNYQNKFGSTALFLASQENKINVVRLLLQQQYSGIMNPLLPEHKESNTPLIIASFRDHTAVVRALLDFDSSPAHLNYQMKHGYTALHATITTNKV